MAYGIYYEQYENLNLKRLEKLKQNLKKKGNCSEGVPTTTREIIYCNKNMKNDQTTYRIIMKNRDCRHLHMVAERKIQGQVCKRSVWLLKEDCIRILDGDIEWMKDSDGLVFYDFYYQMKYEKYCLDKIVENVSSTYRFSEQNYSVILETSKKKLDIAKEEFFSEVGDGTEQLKPGRVHVTYRKKQTNPAVNYMTKELEMQYT